MATQGNPQTQYIQEESPYYFCNVCGRKDYRGLIFNVTYNPTCNAFNSSPSKYPQAQCKGTMTLTTLTIPQSDANLVNDERSYT